MHFAAPPAEVESEQRSKADSTDASASKGDDLYHEEVSEGGHGQADQWGAWPAKQQQSSAFGVRQSHSGKPSGSGGGGRRQVPQAQPGPQYAQPPQPAPIRAVDTKRPSSGSLGGGEAPGYPGGGFPGYPYMPYDYYGMYPGGPVPSGAAPMSGRAPAGGMEMMAGFGPGMYASPVSAGMMMSAPGPAAVGTAPTSGGMPMQYPPRAMYPPFPHGPAAYYGGYPQMFMPPMYDGGSDYYYPPQSGGGGGGGGGLKPVPTSAGPTPPTSSGGGPVPSGLPAPPSAGGQTQGTWLSYQQPGWPQGGRY